MTRIFDYGRARRTADRLITRFGQVGAIRRSTSSSRGDSTNSLSPAPGSASEPTDAPCTLVIVDYSQQERAGTLIKQTDRKALIATKGLAIEPTNDDALVVGGDAYQIVSVAPLAPGGTTVLWEAQVRR